jgi:zinc finger protein
MAEHKSLAKDLFEDMGRKVAEASEQQEEDDSRVVDEIESCKCTPLSTTCARLTVSRVPRAFS